MKTTTKRRGKRSYGWLKIGIVTTSLTATLAGVHFLRWQDANAAAATAEPASSVVRPADKSVRVVRTPQGTFLLELPPVPTVAPPVQNISPSQRVTPPRAVARSRSSR